MSWTLIGHIPPVLMVLPGGMPSDAADVELYDKSDCGEEMRLKLLGPARALQDSGRKSHLMPQACGQT